MSRRESTRGERSTGSIRKGGMGSSQRQEPSAGGVQAGRSAAAGVARQGELLPEGKLYYRIGEVAKITGVKPHVLRYWETEFRWMAPPKSRSKQRLYRRKDIEMIQVIKRLLYEERYTIAGARLQLREIGLAKALEAASSADKLASAEPDRSLGWGQLRAQYRRIRDELVEIRQLL